MHTLFILADNQDITREGVHAYLSRLYPMSPTRNVTGKKELLTTLTLPYSRMVVILDYPLFDLKDVEELLVIVKRFPSTIWILFSSELSENIIRRVGAEPTIGILLKECPGEEIRKALQEAAEGRRYLCAQVSNLLQGDIRRPETQTPLTPSETEILKLIAKGKSIKEIAAIRFSSVHTIMTHKKNIFRKLEVNNVYEATRYALRAGLVEMMEYYI